MARHLAHVLPLAALCSCAGSSELSPLRFRNAGPVWRVADREPIDKPDDRRFLHKLYYFDQTFFRRVEQAMEVPEQIHARNVNALDEVPDSTWFTNRIGVGKIAPADVLRGPGHGEGPDGSEPWRVVAAKVGGTAPGFQIEDARGRRYLVKLDEKGVAEMESGADIVTQRLLWAFGYHVSDNYLVSVDRSQLVVAPDAVIEDAFGRERPMTERDVERQLALGQPSPDGTYRAVASRFLPGEPVGGYAPEGTRPDDPNDTVPHQHRRDLRGQYVIYSWLGYTDVKSENTLDMWVQDPQDPSRRYLVHHVLDFGRSLGVMAYVNRRPSDNYAYVMDFGDMMYSALAVGLWPLPGSMVPAPALPGVGRFAAEPFDPAKWKPGAPWEPFLMKDRFDGFWGAKIISRFTPKHIEAAVAAARYGDPRSAEYLFNTLLARQRKIVSYWFARVSPLDRFAMRGQSLCFEDLALSFGVLAPAAQTAYTARAFDRDGRTLEWSDNARATGSVTCLPDVPLSSSDAGYTIVQLRAERAGRADRPIEVHLARNGDGVARVIGLVRR